LIRPDGHLVTALDGVRAADLYAAAEATAGGEVDDGAQRDEPEAAGGWTGPERGPEEVGEGGTEHGGTVLGGGGA
ncbi:hypothetical protein AB0L81_39165, partial [Streptomyces sp. NPDC052127]